MRPPRSATPDRRPSQPRRLIARYAWLLAAVTGDTELYIGSVDGQFVRRLTDLPGGDFNPAWSPDGADIVFTRNHDLYLVDTTGTTPPRQLTTGGWAGNDNVRPVWSPDGQEIVFQSNRDGQAEIYRIRRDGTDLRRVTENAAGDGYPSWR